MVRTSVRRAQWRRLRDADGVNGRKFNVIASVRMADETSLPRGTQMASLLLIRTAV